METVNVQSEIYVLNVNLNSSEDSKQDPLSLTWETVLIKKHICKKQWLNW